MVSEELRKRIKGLRFNYTDQRQPELLIPIPTDTVPCDIVVTHSTDEFTSLCPLSEYQPDHAEIVVEFIPNDYLVELKSLKYYLTSYRMVRVFHEQVPALILADILCTIHPRWIRVTGHFTIRGGFHTTVIAERPTSE